MYSAFAYIIVLLIQVIPGYTMDKIAEFCDFGQQFSFGCNDNQIISIKSVEYQINYHQVMQQCYFIRRQQSRVCRITVSFSSVPNADLYVGFMSALCNQKETCVILNKDMKDIFKNIAQLMKTKDECSSRASAIDRGLIARVTYNCIDESNIIDVCSNVKIDVIPPRYISYSNGFTKEKPCNCTITGKRITAQVLDIQTQGNNQLHMTSRSPRCQIKRQQFSETISSCNGKPITELCMEPRFYKSFGNRLLVKVSSLEKGEAGAVKITCGNPDTILGAIGRSNMSSTTIQSSDVTKSEYIDEPYRKAFMITLAVAVIASVLLFVVIILVPIIVWRKWKKKLDYTNLAVSRTIHDYQVSRNNTLVSDVPSSSFDSHSYASVHPENSFRRSMANSSSGDFVTVVRNVQTNNTGIAQIPPNENRGLKSTSSDNSYVLPNGNGTVQNAVNKEKAGDCNGVNATSDLPTPSYILMNRNVKGNSVVDDRKVKITTSDASYVFPDPAVR